MSALKTARELMIDVFAYPHIPYWSTLRQAVGIMKKAILDVEKCMYPMMILVFDEKYNLVGTLTMKDILWGLAPVPIKTKTIAGVEDVPPAVDENALAGLEAGLFSPESKQLAKKLISEIVVPIKASVSPDDSVVKAAFLMQRLNIQVLPVIENNKKLVGIVRMVEVFREVSDTILE